MKQSLLKVVLAFCVLASGCTAFSPLDSTGKQTVEVIDVVDGDTVDVRIDNGTETVRLNGVDTPEVHVENNPAEYEGVPDTPEARRCLEDWGEKATAYVREEIGGEHVELHYRVEDGKPVRGDYGRLLGTIYQDNRSINRQLVLKGYARAYSYEGPYIEEERKAKLNVSGVWNCQARRN